MPEAAPILAVNELKHTQNSALEFNRRRQDLGCAIAAFLVPGLIKMEVGVDRLNFLIVVDVSNIQGSSAGSGVSGDTIGADGNTNLTQLGSYLEPRKEFVGVGIDHVNRDPVGFEEVKNSILEINQNGVQIFSCVDFVGDFLKGLTISELRLQFLDVCGAFFSDFYSHGSIRERLAASRLSLVISMLRISG